MLIHAKSRLKIVCYSLVTLIGVFTLSIIIFMLRVNPNHYKAYISQTINAQTGVNVQIGNLSWNWWPLLSLKAQNIDLYIPNTISQQRLAHLDHGKISLRLLPLFYAKLQLDKIFLHGLEINLISDGPNNNWALKNSSSNSDYQINLSKFSLQNATLNYYDLKSKQKWQFNNLSLILNPQNDGQLSYFTLDNSFNAHNVDYTLNQVIHGTLNANYKASTYQANLSAQAFSLSDLLASFNVKNSNAFKQQIWQKIQFNLDLMGNTNSFKLSANPIELNSKSKIKLNLQANSIKPLDLNNQININHLELSDFMKLNGYQLSLNEINLTGNTHDIKQLHQQLSIAKLDLSGYNLHSLALQIATILNNPLKLIEIKPAISRIKARLDALTATNTKNLTLHSNLGSLQAKLLITPNNINFDNLKLNAPDLNLTGNGKLALTDFAINAHLNARFMPNANTLTSKIAYPVYVSNNTSYVNWNEVNQQLVRNMGTSLKNSGKEIGKSGTSSIKRIAEKIKHWF